MARVLLQDVSEDQACPYLQGRCASQEYRLLLDVTAEESHALLERGWRRFGAVYFRPACRLCGECVSLRVPVGSFALTKSQRRIRQRCSRFHVEMGQPRVDPARLELHRKWHVDREKTRGWPPNPIDQARYEMDFCFPHPCARELAWYDGDRLIGVDLVDQTPRALSSVFYFFDPAYGALSPGVASVLHEIEQARALGLGHVYLGFRVDGCASMSYKARFKPHELLLTRPGTDEEPVWVPEMAGH